MPPKPLLTQTRDSKRHSGADRPRSRTFVNDVSDTLARIGRAQPPMTVSGTTGQ